MDDYEHNLTHEIQVMRDLVKGTAEQQDIFYDLRVINPHDNPLSLYQSVAAADSNLLQEINLVGAGRRGLFTADHIYSDVSYLQYHYHYWR